MSDSVLVNDWHPVCSADQLTPGSIVGVVLMGREIALWRGTDGAPRAWEDRCPHRGTRFSIGKVEDGTVVCAYHGWKFTADGRCVNVPAVPGFQAPVTARSYAVTERYGLVWVCAGEPATELLPFPECEDTNLRKVVCGPYDVGTSGPRIVENFLDMAHFGYVHTGILGDLAHTAVRDYQVDAFTDETGEGGVLATQCFAWQPQTNSLAHGGSDVEYTYRVVRPLTAILTKVPQAQQGFREAISLHVQPVDEESSRVWIILAMTNFSQAEEDLRAFQDRIFLQDRPIVENQVPKRLPLAAKAEHPVRSDRMSQAYRRYLSDRGLRYGVLPA
jgi:phenylpropionate dioxygenase-like ring-hydroxylating dioxygenase large terminal subunit